MYTKRIASIQRKTKLPLMLGSAILILLIIQVLVSNNLANYGTTISKIEIEIGDLTQENQLLEEKIASASSLMTLNEKAKKIGFVKVVNPHYFSNQIPVALGGH